MYTKTYNYVHETLHMIFTIIKARAAVQGHAGGARVYNDVMICNL